MSTSEGSDQDNSLHIILCQFPTGLNIRKSRLRGVYKQELTYRLALKVRKAVQRERAHYRYLIRRNAISFHGLTVVRGEELQYLARFAKDAEAAFQRIDKSLHVSLVSVPIDVSEGANSRVLAAVSEAVRQHCFQRVFERLKILSRREKDLPEQSRKSLLDLVDRLKLWNLTRDPKLTEELDAIATRLARKELAAVQEDLESRLAQLEPAEGAYVEY